MELENFLKKDNIIILESDEKQLVIRELLQQLEDLGTIDSGNKYYPHIIHRESIETTGIGKGFAIPHARTDSVTDFISILGISKQGIDYQSYDKLPVKYVLLSIFPTEMSTKYLYLVGMMARMFSNDEGIEKLDKSNTPKEIHSVLEKHFNLYFEDMDDGSKDGSTAIENLTGVPASDLDLIIRLNRVYQLYDEGNVTDSMTAKIEQLKKLIDNKALTYYERMRKKCQDPFSIVEKNRCAGCHLEIPAVHFKTIKEEKKIAVCPHCGRFLILL